MVDIHKVIGNIPFKPKKGFVVPHHLYTGPFNPLHLLLDSQDNPLRGKEPYNAVDAISMRECDRKILAALNALVPKGRHGKVDR